MVMVVFTPQKRAKGRTQADALPYCLSIISYYNYFCREIDPKGTPWGEVG